MANKAVNAIDLFGLLDAHCNDEGGCCDMLEDITPLLNQWVTSQILEGGTIEDIHDRLGKKQLHPYSKELAKIDVWILNLKRNKYWVAGQSRLANFAYAPCIKLKCGGKERCIGADKISHFFQQGFMLFEIYNKMLSEDYNGEFKQKLAESFSMWTEGLYKKPELPTSQDTGIYNILKNESFEFHEIGKKKLKKMKNKWGNILWGLISPASVPDHKANLAGLEFWKKVNDGSLSSFNVCDFVKLSDIYEK